MYSKECQVDYCMDVFLFFFFACINSVNIKMNSMCLGGLWAISPVYFSFWESNRHCNGKVTRECIYIYIFFKF